MNSNGKGEMISALIAGGANPYFPNDKGITPLKIAEMTKGFNLLKFFNV
jgi:ankyrin repeat protein